MKTFFSTIVRVLTRPAYAILAVVIFGAVILVSLWLPNKDLLGYVLASGNLNVVEKIGFLIKLVVGWQSIFDRFSGLLLLLLAALAGINFTLLVYYLKQRIKTDRSAGLGFIGTLVGLLGIGCASCGSVILSSVFGLAAASGFLGILPWHGLEFALIGIALLLLSIVLLARKINNPLICKIK